MLERLVVAISRPDFSVDQLLNLIAHSCVCEIAIVHCVESVLSTPAQDQALASRARKRLNRCVVDAAEHTDIPLRAEVRIGIPAQQIIQAARELAADTIAVGAFVGVPRQELFLGSTVLEIIRYARGNVLVVHLTPDLQHVVGGFQRPLLEHVLFPTDFSDFSLDAFNKLLGLADNRLRRVTLLHVQDATRLEPHLMGRLPEFDATDKQRLLEMAQNLAAKGVQADHRIELAVPEQSIARTAIELDVSCIAIGSRGRTITHGPSWGSVSERVVRCAEAPVLVIKHEEMAPA